jgi:hypothetical protein
MHLGVEAYASVLHVCNEFRWALILAFKSSFHPFVSCSSRHLSGFILVPSCGPKPISDPKDGKERQERYWVVVDREVG